MLRLSTLWRLVGLALVLGSASKGSTFSAGAGQTGRWGAPYGWLGPQQTRAWEEYRKAANPGDFPSIAAADLGSGKVRYDQVRQLSLGQGGTADVSVTPGLFFGASAARRSPSQASLQLIASSASPELRLGFMENLAAGGGASLATMVRNHGGDDGQYMDAYFGNWGVDGLFAQFQFLCDGATWQIKSAGLQLKAAASLNTQLSLVDGQLVLNGSPFVGGPLDLGVSTTTPLDVRWDVRQDASGTTLEGSLGGVVFSWLLDDGVTRHGLSDPGNPDGIGYQGGSLDLDAVVPFFYAGAVSESGDPLPLQLALRLVGSAPRLEGLPSRTRVRRSLSMTVSALAADGSVDPGYRQTVEFTSSDPKAILPEPYTFQPDDQGVKTFSLQFGAPGLHTVNVRDRETPAISGSQIAIDVHTTYDVGCGALPLWLWVPGAALMRTRRRRPTAASSG